MIPLTLPSSPGVKGCQEVYQDLTILFYSGKPSKEVTL